MRTISRLGRALVMAAFLPVVAKAQKVAEPLENSWLWGGGGGRISLPTYLHRVDAPMLSADWLITRSRWALDVYYSQAYFSDSSRSESSPPIVASMKNLRRVGFMGVVFLRTWKLARPYAGVGYSFNFVNQAMPLGTFTTQAAYDDAVSRVEAAKASSKATFTLGVMGTWGRFAPYGQYTMMPTRGSGSWLVNGRGSTSILEAGLRYNIGSSIEKMR